MDVTDTIKAKSDQLNADDLVSGPITVQILGVSRGQADQPVIVKISGGHMAFRPSKTARRVLVHAWGPETDKWVNRWVTLYRDEKVKWAGEEVGGIRIAAMSDIDEAGLHLSLAVSKGKKAPQKVAFLRPANQKQQGAPSANIDNLLAENKLTRADVDRWLAKEGKPTLDAAPDKVPALAVWLGADPKRLEAIRALIPNPGSQTPAEPPEPGSQE